jgi:hypothetical protein
LEIKKLRSTTRLHLVGSFYESAIVCYTKEMKMNLTCKLQRKRLYGRKILKLISRVIMNECVHLVSVDQDMVQEQSPQEVNFSFNCLSVTASTKDSAKYISLLVIVNYMVFIRTDIGLMSHISLTLNPACLKFVESNFMQHNNTNSLIKFAL